MIELLLVDEYSTYKLGGFLSRVFDCSIDRIKFFSMEGFNSLTERLDERDFDCICVLSGVGGDCSELLQLYRYKLNRSLVVERIFALAPGGGINFYMPDEFSDDWNFFCGDGVVKRVRQVNCLEDDCFLFKIIE